MKRIALALIVVFAAAVPAFSASGTIAPFPLHQWFDANGDPCSSCRLFTYSAGTSTKESVYTDVGLTVAHSNPITLNAAGRPASPVFLSPGTSYKFVLAASGSDDPPSSPLWTVDNISAVPSASAGVDITGTAGEAISAGNVVYLSAGDGGRTAGRWYLADADTDYMSLTARAVGFAAASIASGSSGSIRVSGPITGLTALTTGATYYVSATAGGITTTPPTLARQVGIADSTTTIVLSSFLEHAMADATHAGIISTDAQDIPGGKNFEDHPTFEPGTSTVAARISGRRFAQTGSTGNVGAGEDDLFTNDIEANILATTGDVFTVWARFTGAATADTKRVRAYLGGTLCFDGDPGFGLSNGSVALAMVQIHVTGASGQLCTGILWAEDNAGNTTIRTYQATLAKDSTTLLAFKWTGEATNNNDIVQTAQWGGIN